MGKLNNEGSPEEAAFIVVLTEDIGNTDVFEQTCRPSGGTWIGLESIRDNCFSVGSMFPCTNRLDD